MFGFFQRLFWWMAGGSGDTPVPTPCTFAGIWADDSAIGIWANDSVTGIWQE